MKPNKDSVHLVDAVPNEIWRLCWDLTRPNDLKSLSRVCQRFRPICQSLLFKEFTFSISRDPTFTFSRSNVTIIKRKIEALQGVISNQLLVESVRTLRLSTIYLENSINGATHLFVKTDSGISPVVLFLVAMVFYLPRFTKTKALILDWPKRLSGSFLDRVLKVAAGCLPLIEALTVNMKSFPSRSFDEFASLKVLAMGNDRPYLLLEDPQPDGKISIPASVEYLFAQSMDVAPNILLGLVENNNKHQNLISFELHLGRSSFHLFLQCLPFCPQMKCIAIHESLGTACQTLLQLPETSIPKLETFIGPLELALVIVPNRPILCLGIIDQPWKTSTDDSVILRDMSQLARSKGTIKLSFILRIDQHGTLSTITKLFPSLSLLNIQFHDDNDSPGYEPDGDVDVYIQGDRLEAKKPWTDADSLENYPAAEMSSGYKGLVYDVALGRLQLPSTLGTLRLDIYPKRSYYEKLRRNYYYLEPFTFLIARKVVYALAKRYPHLQRVHIGSMYDEWLWVKGRDGMWQARRARYHRTLIAEMLSSEL